MSTHPDLAGGRLTIDLDALVDNWRQLNHLAGKAECAAVVKANAYGCGTEPVVTALAQAGCKTFFVALPEEGKRVKKTSPQSRCFVLNGLFQAAAPHYLDAGLIPILGSLPEIETWSAIAKSHSRSLPCALHMDSGMTRLGMTFDELQGLTIDKTLMSNLDVQLFMTHYACADDAGHPKTELQRKNFLKGAALFPGVPLSAANSAATLQASDHAFDLARPGIALYGGEALNNTTNSMKPVVTLEGRIIQIRTALAGEAVGYGASETLKRDSRIAYVSVGYADGFHRAASNTGVPMRDIVPASSAAFDGKVIKGIGRISMDLSAFDVTDIPESDINPGDWIELIGKSVAVDDVARAVGTIGYEMLTGLGQRYNRIYVQATH